MIARTFRLAINSTLSGVEKLPQRRDYAHLVHQSRDRSPGLSRDRA